MSCNHDLETTYGIRLVFPDSFIVMDVRSCSFTGYESRYQCLTIPDENTIEITDFLAEDITADTLIEFTIDSVISPGNFDATEDISILTFDSNGAQIDAGTVYLEARYLTEGNITDFRVSTQSVTVGDYPVTYDFVVTPNGEMTYQSTLKIVLPDQITILDRNDFETSCGENLYGFTNEDGISCAVSNDLKEITIRDGFLYEASANFTDDDGLYFPPELLFSLTGF